MRSNGGSWTTQAVLENTEHTNKYNQLRPRKALTHIRGSWTTQTEWCLSTLGNTINTRMSDRYPWMNKKWTSESIDNNIKVWCAACRAPPAPFSVTRRNTRYFAFVKPHTFTTPTSQASAMWNVANMRQNTCANKWLALWKQIRWTRTNFLQHQLLEVVKGFYSFASIRNQFDNCW